MEPFAVLYEDAELVVANKTSPLPVQPEKTGDASLQEMLAARYGFIEAVHRIDRRASGAVIFARSRKALVTLAAAFRGRQIEKSYIACVEREPGIESGRLVHRLVHDKRSNRMVALKPEGASEKDIAVLEYRLAGRSERYFFLDIRLVTGRHHQIRAQLAAAGLPIRGDLKYGARRSCANGLIMLHARGLAFAQPRSGARLDIAAPFPETESLWNCMAKPSDRDT